MNIARSHKLLTALALLFAFSLSCFPQTKTKVQGRVTDKDGKPLPSVVVKVYGGKSGGMKTYVLTGKGGGYSVESDGEGLPLRLTFSHIGFKTEERRVSGSGRMDVVLGEEPFALKEVTVKSVPISNRGDTIVYNVSAFKTAADRNIEDVIKKLPGITVEEQTGKISYNGEDINKFYIEGLDLLSGRYRLATKNISPDDIASVSIYENHQPKKVLKDVEYSEKAALNLKLKNNRMLKPVGNFTAGTGYGDKTMWLGELYGMLIGTKSQHLLTAKTNNFGNAYENENMMLANSGRPDADTQAWGLFRDDPFGTSSVPKQRYYYNKSVTSSFNSLFKIGEDMTFTVNGDYEGNDNEYSNIKITDYATGSGQHIVINETNASHTDNKTANLRLKIERNSDGVYLLENLLLRGRFKRNAYSVSGSSELTQSLGTDDYAIGNTFDLTLRRGKGVWQMKSVIGLSGTPMNNISVLNPDGSLMLRQDVTGRAFSTHETTSFTWGINNSSQVSIDASFRSRMDRISSALTSEDGSPRNEDRGYKLETELSPEYQYRSGSLLFTLKFPVSLLNMRYKDVILGNVHTLNKLYVDFRSKLAYTFMSGFRGILTVGQSRTSGDIGDFVTEPIHVTYRNSTTLGAGTFSMSRSLYAMLTLNYRNSLSGLFFTLTGAHRRAKRNTMGSSTVSEQQTSSSHINKESTRYVEDVSVYVGKTLSGIDAVVSAEASGMFMRSTSMRQQMEVGLRSNIYRLSVYLNNSFFKGVITTSLSGKYVKTVQNSALTDGSDEMDSFSGVLGMSLFPVRSLEIYAKGYCNSTDTKGVGGRTDFYLDGGARYIGRSVEVELSVRNLTGRKTYSVWLFSGSDTMAYTYNLRPAEFLVSVKFRI